jgi:MoaA/NifB/PqqE/SkfB family radical SAM enzyme
MATVSPPAPSTPAQAHLALRRAVIFVTTHCNFKCGFCEFAADVLPREKKFHFPIEKWEPLLHDLRAEGCRELYLTGGEPLMHPQFWEMVETADRLKFPIHRITTNGSMAKRMGEQENRLAREAVRAIQVSVDSPRADEHDQSRGFEGAMEKVVEFCKLLHSANVRTHISNVLTRELWPRTTELIEWAHGHGACHVNLQPCNWESNYGDYRPVEDKLRYQIPPSELDAVDRELLRAQRMARRLGVTTNLALLRRWVRAFFECQGTEEFFHDRIFSRFRCYVPHTTVYIGANGEVFPCTLLSHVGSLGEKSFQELWRKDMQRIRNPLDQGKFFSACRSCYCDFPANFRKNLTRHPVRNAGLALRTLAYYTQRLRTY